MATSPLTLSGVQREEWLKEVMELKAQEERDRLFEEFVKARQVEEINIKQEKWEQIKQNKQPKNPEDDFCEDNSQESD